MSTCHIRFCGLAVVFGLLTASPAFHAMADNTPSEPESRVEDMSQPPVKVTFVAKPAIVRLDSDVLLTIRIEAPSELEVELPPLSTRLGGFMLGGMYERGPIEEGGTTTTEHHARLTPEVADEYRIAPMAIKYTDRSVSPPKTGWFATRPMVFDSARAFEGDPGSAVTASVEPVWIRPTLKAVLGYVAIAVGALLSLLILWRLARRVRTQVKLMRMSPRERALKELDMLLSRHLVQKGKVKDFYLQLTMIVRSYIERQHAVRAPEQTTEEFLAAVASDPRFSPQVLARLEEFLQAADLVKFAAHKPRENDIDSATESARKYIRTDAGNTTV